MQLGKTGGVVRVGTRASDLARLQTGIILKRLKAKHPTTDFEVVMVTTSGDKDRSRPIAALGERGVFVKELEEALLANEVDFVVHSLKDLTTDVPSGLNLVAVSEREDARDVLVSRDNLSFDKLAPHARVATSSQRRQAQLRSLRSDLEFVDIRGNIPTRLRKLDEEQCDAIVLAAAGLHRLSLSPRVTQYFDLDVCVPAAGQGALAVECRKGDQAIETLIAEIEDVKTRAEITAERMLLHSLGGGCSVPIGAYAKVSGPDLKLIGCVAALDGSEVFKQHLVGDGSRPEFLADQLSRHLLKAGAERVLTQLRQLVPNTISPP